MRITMSRNPSNPVESLWVLEGRIAGTYALLLENEYRRVQQEEKSKLRINLEHVSFVDEKGIEVLMNMEQDKVILEGASLFVQELMIRVQEQGMGQRAHDPVMGKRVLEL